VFLCRSEKIIEEKTTMKCPQCAELIKKEAKICKHCNSSIDSPIAIREKITIQCSKCGSTYKIDDEKVPEKGANVKCAKCEDIIVVKKPEPFVAI
jgi:predicted Zn finger-like uncharacterized protein